MAVTLERIREARERISPYVAKTPMLRLKNLDAYLGCEVYVKAECMQNAGSFKLRGAMNKALSLSREELDAACQAAHEKCGALRIELNAVETAIKEKKELQRHILNYAKTGDVREGLKACKTEKTRQAYRDEHESDFVILNAAKRYFDSKGLKKLPKHKALQQEIEQLIKDKNRLYNEYREAKKQNVELSTIRHNMERLLNDKSNRKQEEQER